MTSRYRVSAEVDGTVTFFRGWRVSNLLRDAGTKPIYSTPRGAYMVDTTRLPDVLAYLESRNIGVAVTDPSAPSPGGDAA